RKNAPFPFSTASGPPPLRVTTRLTQLLQQLGEFPRPGAARMPRDLLGSGGGGVAAADVCETSVGPLPDLVRGVQKGNRGSANGPQALGRVANWIHHGKHRPSGP